jgi:plasmid stabilization system protein ParE
MAFRVEITPRAQADLDKIYSWVATAAPYRGPSWFDRFERAIDSLSSFPDRCSVERTLSGETRTVRVLLFGRKQHVYRVYFATFEDVVRVLHIRHGAQRDPKRI